jgi:spore coat protein CotH
MRALLFHKCARGAFGCLAIGLAACAAAEERDWFGVSFADYQPGQAVSSVGAAGGAWRAGGPVATNVFDGVRNGIAISTQIGEEIAFEPVAPEGRNVERIEFSMCPNELAVAGIGDFDGAAGLLPSRLSTGEDGYLGFAAAGWIELHGEGVTPVANEWFDGVIELRTVEDVRLVSYLVRKGGDWVRLANAAGATWFRTSAPRVQGGVASVSFTGNGRFADFEGREDDGEALRLYRWAGGTSGDWNEAANWTLSGVPAESAPAAAGDLALIDGTVSITRGEESGRTTDLMVMFDADGADVLGGSVGTDVTIDVTRPRAGKALKAEFGTLFGLAPSYTFTWRRGSTSKSYESSPVSKKSSYTPTAADYEHWFKFTAYDGASAVLEKEFFFSKLPVLYLTTDDGATPSASKETHDGRMFAQGNDEWKSLYDGKMTIKVRGNSTSSYPKKPWKIKLDKKTKMFDIPKSKHWVLLANYNDQSMMRNKLAYDFANDIGSLGMKSTWVECVLNGAWQGTYQFCEHIRIAEDRVNVHDWEGDAGDIAEAFAEANGLTGDQEDALATQLEQDFSWVTADAFTFYDATNRVTLTGKPSELFDGFTQDISGGYLFEFSEEYDEVSKFTTSSGALGVRTMLKSPEYLYSNTDMMNACKNYLQKYWDSCTSVDGYSGEGLRTCDYCDYESMVNYWLVMELFGNNDAVKKSRYAYKDQGAKLVFGPVWDFDWGMGSPRVSSDGTGWKCQEASGKTAYSFFKEWADNPEFCTRLYTRYWQVRDRFEQCFKSGGLMEQYTNYLYEACLVNSAKWNVDYNQGSGNFAADVTRLRNYLVQRLAWLDQQFASVPTLMASVKQSTSTKPYTADAVTLPIKFTGTNSNGMIYTGRPLRSRFAVGGSSARTVSCFVNGTRVADKVALASGMFDATIPAAAFTAKVGEPNCVSFIAYNSSGSVVARNYALVTQVQSGSVLLLR